MKILTPDPKKTEKLYDKLYQKYGKPLEKLHKGEFLAVSKKGKTLIGRSLSEVALKAAEIFGSGNFVFKVGEKAVGKWRRLF